MGFGGIPYADHMDSIGLVYVCFIFVGFNKLFALGFLMTHSRCHDNPLEVKPVVSRVWPVGVIVLCFLSPATNWVEPTFLTYPFLKRTGDRCTYVAFTFACVFSLDRMSRDREC